MRFLSPPPEGSGVAETSALKTNERLQTKADELNMSFKNCTNPVSPSTGTNCTIICKYSLYVYSTIF